MDRAGMLRTYWSVVLPISMPAFVVAAIWQFTSIWNDFLFAVFLIVDPAKWPVTVALNNEAGSLVTHVQRADGRCTPRVAADAHRLHTPWPLLHARFAGGSTERLEMAEIVLKNLTKRYPNGFEAVKDLSLDIAEAELLVLVGPSGCGKTTALRMIAGLEHITSGDLFIGGRRVNDVLERDRDIAMVFQSYALYPHMTVAQNIAFSLKLSRVPKKEIKERVAHASRLLGLEALLDRRPKQLKRRPAPACRHGPRDRPAAAGVPDGRAALEPRRAASRAHARRDPVAAEAARRDDGLRHARPGRGDDDGGSRRRPARRRAAAGRTRRRTSTTGP